MKFFARCIDSIERRPFIFGSLIIFFLVFSWLEQFAYSVYKTLLADEVTKMFSFLSSADNGNITNLGNAVENAASQNPESTGSAFLMVFLTAVLLLMFSAAASVYFSGYFHVFNISLKPNKEKVKGEFKKGLIKHYFKFTIYIFSHIIILLLAIAGAAYAIFPAKISFDMVFSGDENGLLLTSIFLFIITVVVVIFILSLILMYSMYMYPALINFKKGSFYMTRKIVNAKFWYILPRLMVFTTIILIWQLFMARIGYGIETFPGAIAAFILNGIVKTYLIFSLVFFVFFTFRQIKNAIQTEEAEEENPGKINAPASKKILTTRR